MIDAFDPGLKGGTATKPIGQWREKQRKSGARHAGWWPFNLKMWATRIALVRPFAVDACSSLEASPGKKDFTTA
jgi:phosphoribosylanthranilate isomerase